MLPFLIAGARRARASGAGSRLNACPAGGGAALVLALALLAGPRRSACKPPAAATCSRAAPEILRAIAAAADALVFVEDRGWHGDHRWISPSSIRADCKAHPLVMAAADGTEIAAARFSPAGGLSPGGRFRPRVDPLNSSAPYAVAINPARAHRRAAIFRRRPALIERLARAGRDAAGMLLFGNYRYICPGRFQSAL